MAQRRHHYERAFEWFLRSRRIPYVAVDEARKALVPHRVDRPPSLAGPGGADPCGSLKSFDFVIYGDSGVNLLVDIKGRRVGSSTRHSAPGISHCSRLESWVTREDIESLTEWEKLFGEGFSAAFVFVYWCAAQPPDALFQEIFEHGGVWYALRAVTLGEYVKGMKTRSERWRTVDLPRRVFEQVSQPFAPALAGGGSGGLLVGVGDLGPEVPALLPR